jgi:hypothetical protein
MSIKKTQTKKKIQKKNFLIKNHILIKSRGGGAALQAAHQAV